MIHNVGYCRLILLLSFRVHGIAGPAKFLKGTGRSIDLQDLNLNPVTKKAELLLDITVLYFWPRGNHGHWNL